LLANDGWLVSNTHLLRFEARDVSYPSLNLSGAALNNWDVGLSIYVYCLRPGILRIESLLIGVASHWIRC
jgi:hypothetical protein